MRFVLYTLLRVVMLVRKHTDRFMARYFYQMKVEQKALAFQPPLRVNGPSYINGQTRLGSNVNFNGLEIVGEAPVSIGSNFHSGVGCRLIAQNHRFRGATHIPYDDTFVRRGIVIEDNVWLGDRVIVLDGVTIGEGAIVQAGSVVVTSIPPCAIAGGHPARVFSHRDREHYDQLKKEGKFL